MRSLDGTVQQSSDNSATISREEQQSITVNAAVEMLVKL
jgi:hypothetical protein